MVGISKFWKGFRFITGGHQVVNKSKHEVALKSLEQKLNKSRVHMTKKFVLSCDQSGISPFFQHLIFFLDGTETGGILQGDVLSWLAYIATATKNRNMFPRWYRWCIDDVYLVFKVVIFFLGIYVGVANPTNDGFTNHFFTWLFEWRSSIEEVIRVYEFGNDTNLNPINPYRSYSHISSYFPDPDVGVISWGSIWKPTKWFRKMQLRVLGHFWILGCQFFWGLDLITLSVFRE